MTKAAQPAISPAADSEAQLPCNTFDMSPNSSSRAFQQVLNGEADYDSLSFFEQAVFRSRRDERTRQRLRRLDLEAAFAAEERSYVELDGDGNVAERHPRPSS